MSSIAERLDAIRATIPTGVRLLAISKYYPCEAVMEAYNAGQRDFGENKAQDLIAKQQELPTDIRWHFTGHLQSNKIKYIAPFVYMIHSIDSMQLLREINKHGAKNARTIPCLLQIHIAQEETKFGFTTEECLNFLRSGAYKDMQGIVIAGIMCMATNTDNEQRICQDFKTANDFFQQCCQEFPDLASTMQFRSWGMSDDFHLAIQYGSNIIRIGSSIFGHRIY